MWKEDNNQPKGQINGPVDKEYKKRSLCINEYNGKMKRIVNERTGKVLMEENTKTEKLNTHKNAN